MKLSSRLRSLGAALVCISMVLCNVPLVQAGDVVIGVGPVEENVYGNGTSPILAMVYDELLDAYVPTTVWPSGGYPYADPPDGNSVTLTASPTAAGSVLGNVYGGYAGILTTDQSADSNIVEMSYGTSVNGNVYGGYAEDGDATLNSASIQGNVTGSVYGGYAMENAANNNVSITNAATGSGSVTGNVYGGRAIDGDATDNTVYIRNSSVTGTAGDNAIIAGGSTVDGEANSNTVTINATGDTANLQYVNVAGGRSVSGDVTENTVNISAGSGGTVTINGSVYGGYTVNGTQTVDNAVNISTTGTGSVSVTNVYGMYAVDADSQYNVLTFEGGSTVGSAYAGYSKDNDVHDNWVTVNPTNLDGGTGWTEQANTVNITGNVDVKNVYAGYTEQGGASFNLIDIKGAQENGHFYAGYTENGEAYDNHVLVNGLDVGSFHGGHSDSGTAHDNTITVTMGSIKNLYGGSTEGGTAEYNDVSIIAGRVDETIYGGYAASGEANYNMVTIAGASDNVPQNIIIPPNINAVVHDVYGGYSESNLAGGNIVEVYKYGSVFGNVVGGYSGFVTSDESSGTTQLNTVLVNDGAIIHGDVYGGKSGAARENHVIIDGGVIDGDIIGGGNAVLGFYTRDNVVEIYNNATVGDVYGGKISTGKAVENYVIIDGSSSEGTSGGTVYGGYTESGWVEGNAVEISYGTFGDVYGGRASDGYANDNVVFLGHGNIGSIYGGVTTNGLSNNNIVYIENSTINGNDIVGGRTGSGNATGNIITITGNDTAIRNSSATIIGGDTSAGDASYNFVGIDQGEVNAQRVIGGRSGGGNANNNFVDIGYLGGDFIISDVTGGLSSNGSARYNDVTIGGNSGTFSGKFTDVHGGRSSGSGDASDNTVSIYSGSFTNIYGGRADGAGYARNNAVNLYGGTFNGLIYGGYSASGSATNNTIVIHPSAILSAGTRLYGGYTGSSSNDARTGNTLDIRKPITITGIGNFANYDFNLPAGFAAGDTMITVTNGNGNGGAIDLKDATVGITVNEGSTLQQGNTVILIDEKGGSGFDGAPATKRVSSSGFVDLTFDLNVVENQLQANITGASLDERTNSIPEGFLSGLILANQGADAIAGSAMDSAMTAAHKGPIAGLGGFGSLIIGKSEYDTGSDVDMIGISAAAGLALGTDLVSGSLTLGPFFEYGKAEFDTVNSLGGDLNVIGDGDSEYMGGGFLLRMDYKDVGLGRYFAEVSARVGRQTNNFNINWPGEDEFSYKSTAPYYGIHLGYGGSWDVAKNAAMDIYGKYFFARGNSSNVSTSSGDDVTFEAVTSNRVRGGMRMAYVPGDSLALSFGGAYEYEISGEIKASMMSYAINAPSLKGGTGIGEVVVGYKPSPSSRTSINFGVQGYAGKRQGVTGSVFLRF